MILMRKVYEINLIEVDIITEEYLYQHLPFGKRLIKNYK
jgi:hypothetical protein